MNDTITGPNKAMEALRIRRQEEFERFQQQQVAKTLHQQEEADKEADKVHQQEMADYARAILRCQEIIRDYGRYEEHTPAERVRRVTCLDMLEDNQRQRRMR